MFSWFYITFSKRSSLFVQCVAFMVYWWSHKTKPQVWTHQSDLLHERISPFKNSKEELIALLRRRSFVVELHQSRLDGPTQIHKSILLKLISILHTSSSWYVWWCKYLLSKLNSFGTFPRSPHQGHLDPGSESSREGPFGVVPLTLSHEVWLIFAAESKTHSVCVIYFLYTTDISFFYRSGWQLPLNQVTKLSEKHVGDAAEVLLCCVATELHEDQLFVSDISRTTDHQSLGLWNKNNNRSINSGCAEPRTLRKVWKKNSVAGGCGD